MCSAPGAIFRRTTLKNPEDFMRKFVMVLAAIGALAPAAANAEAAVKIAAPAAQSVAEGTSETAVLAGGCFWGIQAVYQHIKGVTNAVSGYAGGDAKSAHYQMVGMGTTGHAEAVKVTFDPRVVSYGQILQVFFSVAHDPTQLNRQGPDTGPQYRSEIFPQSEAQAKTARDYIAQLDTAKSFKKPIVTKTETMKSAFFPAEDYHQDYATKHPWQPYIVINDAPKVQNLKTMFPELWRDEPVTVAQAGGATN
jgi:peptide-methionine (S)-S-oxide reductase